jgi:zinc protease
MKILKLVLLILVLATTLSGTKDFEKSSETKTKIDANSCTHETVENDPTGLRLYALEKGLKVYLSQNNEAPKIHNAYCGKSRF